MQELWDGVDVDEVDDGKDKLGLSSGNSFAIGEKFTAFIFDILFKLG